MRASLRTIAIFGAFLLPSACGSSTGDLFDSSGGGPAAAMGGRTSAGAPSSGGSNGGLGDGGAAVTGGASTSGGKMSGGSGGAMNAAGGKPTAAAGGADATLGGAGATGGGSAEGGVPAGGVPGTGGSSNSAPVVQSGSLATTQFSDFACHHVTFATPFAVPAGKLRVLASVVHPGSSVTHDPVTAWAQGISATGFDACLSEDAGSAGDHTSARVDWVALAEPDATTWNILTGRQALTGDASPDCNIVSLGRDAAATTYHLQLSLEVSKPGENQGTAVWVENVNAADFRLCARPLENANGPLSANAITWAVYSPTALGHGFVAGELDFTKSWEQGTQCKKVSTTCKSCQNAQVSVNHRRRTEDANMLHGSTLVWAEDFNQAGELNVCVRESSAENGSHDTHLSVDWLVREHND